jgi:predicted enzyme related to lactoylglutathione lyase
MASVLRSVSAVRIFTHDLERAHGFYAGTLSLKEQSAGPGYIVFELDGVDIIVEAVAPDDPEGPQLVGRRLATSFRVDDVEAAYRQLSDRGVAFVQPPEKQHWGGTLAFARDPDQNVITLVDQASTDRMGRAKPVGCRCHSTSP